MKTSYFILITLLSLALNGSQCQTGDSGNNLIIFASGLNRPVCIANAGDSRLFVVDQTGYIYIIDSQGNVNPQAFLDIHDRVLSGGEQGLLGLAFHPQYADNGYFYVYYIGEEDSVHISRFETEPGNPDLADSLSEREILTFAHPYTNHNGGDLHFGPDDYLYIGTGDGGSAGDPENRAQNLSEYLGKMLRIDVNEGDPYAIPPSNPFITDINAREEIWAYGLRNPWRFSFDRLTGDLWIGDVGQNAIEEIDLQMASSAGGENYGWRCYEGNQEYNTTGCASPEFYKFPIYTYLHNPECSITGGYVYRGNSTSPYYGQYFFADYCSDWIWSLHLVAGKWESIEYGQFPGNDFSAFGEDVSGQIYIAGLTTGIIYRLIDNSTGVDDVSKLPEVKIIQSPSSSIIRIITSENEGKPRQISLYNLQGAEMMSHLTGQSDYGLNVGNLVSGIYILKVEISGINLVRKIVLY
jgi:glucose/arabinose dehydrogenase